jgi:hypothetical protein
MEENNFKLDVEIQPKQWDSGKVITLTGIGIEELAEFIGVNPNWKKLKKVGNVWAAYSEATGELRLFENKEDFEPEELPGYEEDDMPEAKLGDKIQVFNYIANKFMEAEVLSLEPIRTEDGYWEISILFPNGDEWVAIWVQHEDSFEWYWETEES